MKSNLFLMERNNIKKILLLFMVTSCIRGEPMTASEEERAQPMTASEEEATKAFTLWTQLAKECYKKCQRVLKKRERLAGIGREGDIFNNPIFDDSKHPKVLKQREILNNLADKIDDAIKTAKEKLAEATVMLDRLAVRGNLVRKQEAVLPKHGLLFRLCRPLFRILRDHTSYFDR